MQLTKQSAILLPQEPGLEGVYKQIELAARTCYKSEDRTTPESAKRMVDALIKNEHTAMLEHGTVYLYIPFLGNGITISHYINNPYSIARAVTSEEGCAITTNYRVLVENKWTDDLKYLITEPTEEWEQRYTVKVVTNMQVSNELVRHRAMSYGQESSRYCNYSKDKFNNELTFIYPNWLKTSTFQSQIIWLRQMERVEYDYLALLKEGWKPEQAAQVLPKATKTELVITGTETQWKNWLNLRFYEKTGKVHPQMKELSTLVKDILPI